MTGPDWLVVAFYLMLMVGMGAWLARRQRDTRDYFLAGRSMGSLPVALSMVATQVSAVSLVGAPAFIALKQGGGLRWWQYEFAVPLAMAVLMVTLVPVFHRTGAVTIYHYLEGRFGPGLRTLVSGVFLISRGLASGVILFTTGVVLAGLLSWPVQDTLLVVAAVTILYTTLGGIAADIYSDILQLFVLFFTALLMVGLLALDAGGNLPHDPGRFRVFFPEHWGFSGETYGLWPMLIGGFFLYLSYYGTDQSEAQRLLTTASAREAQKALLLNGLLRFPLVFTYSLVGILLAGYLAAHPDFLQNLSRPDDLVPLFVREHFPTGLRGLFLAGVFAATMSSIDSAMNALSAATLEDFLKRFPGFPALSPRRELFLSRVFTVLWGGVATLFALTLIHSGDTVIEIINRLGSLFYGPVFGVFMLGLTTRAGEKAAVLGLLAGVAANFAISTGLPQVSWLWWNLTGFASTITVGALLGRRFPASHLSRLHTAGWHEIRAEWARRRRHVLLLLLMFVLIIGVSLLAEHRLARSV